MGMAERHAKSRVLMRKYYARVPMAGQYPSKPSRCRRWSRPSSPPARSHPTPLSFFLFSPLLFRLGMLYDWLVTGLRLDDLQSTWLVVMERA